ncbi:hypothetical protein [Shewanella algae]|uniref:hypothetical protein n=1 Tax=Shewanella algae TaxID=38313 RepID=UPI0031F4AEBC
MKRAFFLSLILMSLPLVAAARDNSHAERHYQGDIHREDDNRRHNHGSRSHWGLYWGVNNPWLSPWRYDPWNRWQWDDPWYRDRWHRPYVYRRQPKPEPVVVAPPQRVTTHFETLADTGSRASLPANARVIQQGNRTLYQWQGKTYQFDWQSQTYRPLPQSLSEVGEQSK